VERILLGVNVDHVATIRQQRGTRYPDPVTAASIAELAGADQITIHLREDRRHILDRDLTIMKETVQTRLNLEMAATEEMSQIALKTMPDQITLVPEKREERTTEGGLDVVGQMSVMKPYVARLREAGLRVIMFVDPDEEQIEASHAVGAQGVEIHTGDYCDAPNGKDRANELNRIYDTSEIAANAGLYVAAGHGLDYVNVEAICSITPIVELNIGHSIIARALFVGMDQAVREMLDILDGFARDDE